MKRLLILILSLVSLFLFGCGQKPEASSSESTAELAERRRAESAGDSAWAKKLPAAKPEQHPLVRTTKYDAEGNVIFWVDYALNSDGRPVKATPHAADGVLSAEDYLITYEYSNGYLVAENDYSNDGERLIYRRKFDADGRELKWILYDENEKVDIWYENSYNERGECVSHMLCREGEPPKVMNQREYDYDENGYISQCRYLNGKGSVIHIYDYDYILDNAGRIISYRQYDASASLLVEWYCYSYDEAGRVVSEAQLDLGQRVLIRTDTVYDAQGRPARRLIYSSDGKLAVILEDSYQ